MRKVLRVGDLVLYEAVEHQVVAVSGSWVRLIAPGRPPAAVLLTHLVSSDGFTILGTEAESTTLVSNIDTLDDVPACSPGAGMGTACDRNRDRAAAGRGAREAGHGLSTTRRSVSTRAGAGQSRRADRCGHADQCDHGSADAASLPVRGTSRSGRRTLGALLTSAWPIRGWSRR